MELKLFIFFTLPLYSMPQSLYSDLLSDGNDYYIEEEGTTIIKPITQKASKRTMVKKNDMILNLQDLKETVMENEKLYKRYKRLLKRSDKKRRSNENRTTKKKKHRRSPTKEERKELIYKTFLLGLRKHSEREINKDNNSKSKMIKWPTVTSRLRGSRANGFANKHSSRTHRRETDRKLKTMSAVKKPRKSKSNHLNPEAVKYKRKYKIGKILSQKLANKRKTNRNKMNRREMFKLSKYNKTKSNISGSRKYKNFVKVEDAHKTKRRKYKTRKVLNQNLSNKHAKTHNRLSLRDMIELRKYNQTKSKISGIRKYKNFVKVKGGKKTKGRKYKTGKVPQKLENKYNIKRFKTRFFKPNVMPGRKRSLSLNNVTSNTYFYKQNKHFEKISEQHEPMETERENEDRSMKRIIENEENIDTATSSTNKARSPVRESNERAKKLSREEINPNITWVVPGEMKGIPLSNKYKRRIYETILLVSIVNTTTSVRTDVPTPKSMRLGRNRHKQGFGRNKASSIPKSNKHKAFRLNNETIFITRVIPVVNLLNVKPINKDIYLEDDHLNTVKKKVKKQRRNVKKIVVSLDKKQTRETQQAKIKTNGNKHRIGQTNEFLAHHKNKNKETNIHIERKKLGPSIEKRTKALSKRRKNRKLLPKFSMTKLRLFNKRNKIKDNSSNVKHKNPKRVKLMNNLNKNKKKNQMLSRSLGYKKSARKIKNRQKNYKKNKYKRILKQNYMKLVLPEKKSNMKKGKKIVGSRFKNNTRTIKKINKGDRSHKETAKGKRHKRGIDTFEIYVTMKRKLNKLTVTPKMKNHKQMNIVNGKSKNNSTNWASVGRKVKDLAKRNSQVRGPKAKQGVNKASGSNGTNKQRHSGTRSREVIKMKNQMLLSALNDRKSSRRLTNRKNNYTKNKNKGILKQNYMKLVLPEQKSNTKKGEKVIRRRFTNNTRTIEKINKGERSQKETDKGKRHKRSIDTFEIYVTMKRKSNKFTVTPKKKKHKQINMINGKSKDKSANWDSVERKVKGLTKRKKPVRGPKAKAKQSVNKASGRNGANELRHSGIKSREVIASIARVDEGHVKTIVRRNCTLSQLRKDSPSILFC